MKDSYRIMSLEAKDVYGAMQQESQKANGFSIRYADGQMSLTKFSNTLDWSLDTMKLIEVYNRITGRNDFSFS